MDIILKYSYKRMNQQQDFYMYSHSSRFTGSLTGQNQYNNRFGQPFEMNTSTQHKQFHQMKAEMPSDVLQLFKANEIAFLRAPVKPKCRALDPVTVSCKDVYNMFNIPNENLMEREKGQTRQQKRKRVAVERGERNAHRIDVQIQEWNPFADSNVKSDPQKTLLVARLNYKTTEKTLKYQFEKYGIIKDVRVIRDTEGNSKGYAFIQFDNKEDFVTAYKNANYRKIDGYKIIVDFERGRTLLNWRPRKFAGGRGYMRLTREEVEIYERQQRLKRKNDHQERERSRSAHRKTRHEQKEKKKQKQKEKERKSSKDRDRKDKKEKRQKKEKSRYREDQL